MTDESQSMNGETPEILKSSDGNGFFSASPEIRARAAGRYLANLAVAWGLLSILGALIMMLQTRCDEGYSYGSCDGDLTHPYVAWAIASLLANLIVASFMYAIGTYIEARMSKDI